MERKRAKDPVILQLSGSQVKDAVNVLSKAFAEDPILTFYFREPRRRRKAFRAIFGNIVKAHLRFGHVYVASLGDEVAGVAVWRPPDADKEAFRDQLRDLRTRIWLRLLFPRTAGGMLRGFRATVALHPDEPNWYLFFVGIDPSFQGRGIGSMLLSPVLKLADRTGRVCYLETPFPRTLPFYRRLGFETKTESNPFRGAPTLWTMTRGPIGHRAEIPLNSQ